LATKFYRRGRTHCIPCINFLSEVLHGFATFTRSEVLRGFTFLWSKVPTKSNCLVFFRWKIEESFLYRRQNLLHSMHVFYFRCKIRSIIIRFHRFATFRRARSILINFFSNYFSKLRPCLLCSSHQK